MSDSDACATLATVLEDVGTGSLAVVTGAGVSLASGIPTFRGTDPGAVWKRDITELGTNRYFEEDPAGKLVVVHEPVRHRAGEAAEPPPIVRSPPSSAGRWRAAAVSCSSPRTSTRSTSAQEANGW